MFQKRCKALAFTSIKNQLVYQNKYLGFVHIFTMQYLMHNIFLLFRIIRPRYISIFIISK